MTSPGQLLVRAQYAGGQVEAIEAALERPPVARLFVGQHPDVVVKTVPYLYMLCAHAQRAAAQAALSAATGEPRRPVDAGELWIEFLHENLWRLLLDWPAALDLPPAREAFTNWRAARQGADRAAVTQALLDGALRELAEKCLEKLVDRSDPPPFAWPAMQPDAWLAYWQGMTPQVPVALRPRSIAGAYRRRLAEVHAATEALADNAPYPVATAGSGGFGVAQTLTARGVLTHAVHVEDEKVVKYRVWAPTDAYFADAAGLSALLAGHRYADIATARHGVDQAVLALDPCLPYVVELENA